jgi:hypothetical protein
MGFSFFYGKQDGLRGAKKRAPGNGFVSGWYSVQGSWRDGKYVCTEEVVRETRTTPG